MVKHQHSYRRSKKISYVADKAQGVYHDKATHDNMYFDNMTNDILSWTTYCLLQHVAYYDYDQRQIHDQRHVVYYDMLSTTTVVYILTTFF
jgi:hypothetical protein